jgi:hypothetical protein
MAAVAQIVRYGETKAHLENALHELHTAMAITPWFELVDPLAEVANSVAGLIASHSESFRQALAGPQQEEADRG